MSENPSFVGLMEQLRSGEESAAAEVFNRYTQQLVALARGRISDRLAQKVDPEDVVQSAYRSFFVRHREGKLKVANWQSLWGLLTLITLRKCLDRVEHFGAEGRDLKREISADPRSPEGEPWRELLGREPTPDHAAALTETVERLLAALEPDERAIVAMSLEGHSTQEISTGLGRAERSVRRVRERVRLQLERWHGEG
jgi:RNA polymerase sigma factor (sigma-70 family)